MTNGAADSVVLEAEYENAANFSIGATTDNLPPGVLYRVKATYKYNREDVDELSFDVGEIIRVVEYDDPEEQVINATRQRYLLQCLIICISTSLFLRCFSFPITGRRLVNGYEGRRQ